MSTPPRKVSDDLNALVMRRRRTSRRGPLEAPKPRQPAPGARTISVPATRETP